MVTPIKGGRKNKNNSTIKTLIMNNKQTKKIALNEITKAYNEMHEALKYYKAGIKHFYNCINFKDNHLDAKAIDFMNQSELKISAALRTVEAAPEIVES